MEVPIRINGNPLPKPQGEQDCTLCQDEGKKRVFPDWDQIAIHITLVHNRKGRTREFWKNQQPPQEVLEHPDWTGFED